MALPKPKQQTRDDLIKQVASLQAEIEICKDRAGEDRRKAVQLSQNLTDLKGIIAELEREKAMLQGYIERDLQDKADKQLPESTDDDSDFPAPLSERSQIQRKVNPFRMPSLRGEPAGIDETTNSGYGSSTKRKPWYKL